MTPIPLAKEARDAWIALYARTFWSTEDFALSLIAKARMKLKTAADMHQRDYQAGRLFASA